MKKLCILALFLSSCSYRFSALERKLPGGYDRVAVPMFKNSSYEVGIEPFFTGALIEELQRDNFSKVTTKENAQVILEGNVSSVDFGQGASLEDENLKRKKAYLVTEYRIYVSVSLTLKRASDQKVLWAGSFSGEKPYPAPQVTTDGLDSVNPNYNHSARMQNMKILAKDVMNQAYMNMTENF
ncbi:MAG: LptE family protein [Bdellovibrionales bacterium]